jgi:DNA-binding transcriptional MerR regulator
MPVKLNLHVDVRVKPEVTMRISELTRRTGATQRALRYYEEKGLLQPERLPSGYREYAEADVDVVRRIRILLAAGLSTPVIAEILPCLVDYDELLVAACPELKAGLAQERERIGNTINELEAARALLAAIIDDPVVAGP